jgi:hypothetical protein
MLEMFNIPYIPMESLSMQERLRMVTQVLKLAGLRDKTEFPAPIHQAPAAAMPPPRGFTLTQGLS